MISRSFKKTPITKDNARGRKKDKRHANKKVRNTSEVSNGKQYRKVYNTWDIYDYCSHCSLNSWLKSWEECGRLFRYYQTKEDAIQAWRRSYYLK